MSLLLIIDTKVLATGSLGNALASNLLSGKTATVDAGLITGTMPNNGVINITPSANNQGVAAGYTSGGTVYGDANLVAGNIKSGVNIFGVAGNLTPYSFTPGTFVLLSAPTARATSSTTYAKLKEFQVQKSGVIRVSFYLSSGSTGDDAYGRIFKNGVAFGTERFQTGLSGATYTEDITVAIGDIIQIYAHTGNGTMGITATIANATIGVDGTIFGNVSLN